MIPFDALSLAAIADEIKVIVGAKVQGIRQPNPTTIVIELYHRGTAHQLLVCCHPEFFRTHFVTQRPRNSGEPPVFCATLRARLDAWMKQQGDAGDATERHALDHQAGNRAAGKAKTSKK